MDVLVDVVGGIEYYAGKVEAAVVCLAELHVGSGFEEKRENLVEVHARAAEVNLAWFKAAGKLLGLKKCCINPGGFFFFFLSSLVFFILYSMNSFLSF